MNKCIKCGRNLIGPKEENPVCIKCAGLVPENAFLNKLIEVLSDEK